MKKAVKEAASFLPRLACHVSGSYLLAGTGLEVLSADQSSRPYLEHPSRRPRCESLRSADRQRAFWPKNSTNPGDKALAAWRTFARRCTGCDPLLSSIPPLLFFFFLLFLNSFSLFLSIQNSSSPPSSFPTCLVLFCNHFCFFPRYPFFKTLISSFLFESRFLQIRKLFYFGFLFLISLRNQHSSNIARFL